MEIRILAEGKRILLESLGSGWKERECEKEGNMPSMCFRRRIGSGVRMKEEEGSGDWKAFLDAVWREWWGIAGGGAWRG